MSCRITPSICRNCLAYCPIVVSIEDGKAVKVVGDPDAPAFDGYICPKGRSLPSQHYDSDRLLQCHARKENTDGFHVIESERALDEIAARVSEIIAKYGPRSIATYVGIGGVSTPAGAPLGRAWFRAIKSPMVFHAATLDKPAEYISVALHGNWHAGMQTFESSDTWIIVGANPVISKSNGAPLNNPGMRLKEANERGMKLIVIDPRRTETAKRAHIHLQPRPGEDPVLLAGIIHILINEGLYDGAFVSANAEGFRELKAAVAAYDPDFVSRRADVPVAKLLEAARTFGRGKRGGVVCSTGPSFSTRSNLAFYLGLCLNTLCGRWVREGELAPHPNILLPAFVPRAQPYAPYPATSDRRLRIDGFQENASGMPSAALADEILLDGEGQVRVLFCIGSNPVLSWPDQVKAEAAMKKLDLLVVSDYRMTATAQFAHYVLPPPLSLEVPGVTQKVEALKYNGVSRGYAIPWAQYSPAIVEPPANSDLVDDGALFFGLAQRMGLQLDLIYAQGQGPNLEGVSRKIALDMTKMPTSDQLIEMACAGSRIPLEEVKSHPHGHLYQLDVRVQPREPGCTAKLQLADQIMMNELVSLYMEDATSRANEAFPFRLISRRANGYMNSVGQSLDSKRAGNAYAPAFIHSRAMSSLGIRDADLIKISSNHGYMLAQAKTDDTLREDLISVVHGFGAPSSLRSGELPSESSLASVTRLLHLGERDPITGIPRMSAVPVAVRAWQIDPT